jgi:transposase
MRKIKEVLRLKAAGLSHRKIVKATSTSRPSVAEYIRRAQAAQLGWPLPPDLGDADIKRLLFPLYPTLSNDQRPTPNWQTVHAELKRKGVTLDQRLCGH